MGLSPEEREAVFECAAKVESCIATRVCPQSGQAGEAELKDRTSFSNLVPQCSHLYS